MGLFDEIKKREAIEIKNKILPYKKEFIELIEDKYKLTDVLVKVSVDLNKIIFYPSFENLYNSNDDINFEHDLQRIIIKNKIKLSGAMTIPFYDLDRSLGRDAIDYREFFGIEAHKEKREKINDGMSTNYSSGEEKEERDKQGDSPIKIIPSIEKEEINEKGLRAVSDKNHTSNGMNILNNEKIGRIDKVAKSFTEIFSDKEKDNNYTANITNENISNSDKNFLRKI